MIPTGPILEGIVTTINEDDSVNISPMGPRVDEAMTTLYLRPYQTSTTYKNLNRTGQGVLHVTDDVELLARAAVSRLTELPRTEPATKITGHILTDACRWYEFQVQTLDDSKPRTEITAKVVTQGRNRDFFGFNRAKHAIVEAAILATRTEWLSAEEILSEIERLSVLVEKTAGVTERRAFAFLQEYIREAISDKSSREA